MHGIEKKIGGDYRAPTAKYSLHPSLPKKESRNTGIKKKRARKRKKKGKSSLEGSLFSSTWKERGS